MIQTLVSIFSSYGYAAVFGVLILCGLGLPVPEDVSLVAGGIISGLGYTDPYIMLAVSMAGVLIGDSTVFYIGKTFGEKFFDKKLSGRIITPARYQAIKEWFGRYGKWMLFAARFMPGLRSAIFLTAGVTRFVRYRVFIIIDLSAALISVPVWIYLGYYGASNWDWLAMWISRSHMAILVIIALFAVLIAAHTIFKRKIKRIEKRFGDSGPEQESPQ